MARLVQTGLWLLLAALAMYVVANAQVWADLWILVLVGAAALIRWWIWRRRRGSILGVLEPGEVLLLEARCSVERLDTGASLLIRTLPLRNQEALAALTDRRLLLALEPGLLDRWRRSYAVRLGEMESVIAWPKEEYEPARLELGLADEDLVVVLDEAELWARALRGSGVPASPADVAAPAAARADFYRAGAGSGSQ